MSKKTGTTKGGNTGKPGGNVSRPDLVDQINKDPLAEPVKETIEEFNNRIADHMADIEVKPAITHERWEQAQKAEREQHAMDVIEGAIHYGRAYKNYFKYLGLGNNLHGLNVIEVGPAGFPALATCVNWGTAIIVEPMVSEILLNTCKEYGFELCDIPFESIEFKEQSGITEVWLLNVMQHVIDPEAFIQKAKQVADRIRFFEPIDQPVTSYHPHTYSLKDYQRWFGGCVNLYVGGSTEGFHQADCAYGVWVKEQ